MKINPEHGFTILELLIVIAIIAIIAAIGIPNYAGSREESRKIACIANLRQINSAVEQWVIENSIPVNTTPSESDEKQIYSYLKTTRPACPSGGTYVIHATGSAKQVTCSLSDKGHTL